MVLGILFLIVTLVAVASMIRQLRLKHIFPLLFSAVSVLAFGFFSIMTIISEISG